MTGTYTSFVKAGRLFVPVEIRFIPSVVVDEKTGQKSVTSKWADQHHFIEIKELLKTAVELALKYHNEINIGNDRNVNSTVPKMLHKSFTSIGYVYEFNKGKFTDMVCPKAISKDEENSNGNDNNEDNSNCDIDETTGLMDYGGHFKTYSPTEVYIKACALLKSENAPDDEKKIYRELGIKDNRLDNFFTRNS